jgi:hypothetical protein
MFCTTRGMSTWMDDVCLDSGSLLRIARELADRFLPAFDTPTGCISSIRWMKEKE